MTEAPKAATIMVVDDTPANLALLDSILRGGGYRVLSFPRGEQALSAAARHPPDLVLLDINMPGLDGYQVCERLKADEALKEIPVLFISALTGTEGKVKGFAVGAVDYVTKPFEVDEVLARVRAHLTIKRFREELLQKNRELDDSYHRLAELEALRESLTHMIVHDLRSPLMGIVGYLDLLEDDLEDSPSADPHRLVGRIRGAAVELKARIDTVLDVYRLEGGAMPLSLGTVDLRELAERALRALGAEALGLQIEREVPAQPLHVTCDGDLVERVLTNLLGNSVKFAPQGSTLRIALEAGGSEVRVVVQDEGPGVPPEHRETIFDKFKQVGARKAGHRVGSGLGLAFCKMAVEAHGGTIGMESPPAGGSLFWFRLPLAPATKED